MVDSDSSVGRAEAGRLEDLGGRSGARVGGRLAAWGSAQLRLATLGLQ